MTWAAPEDGTLTEHNTVEELVRIYQKAEADIRAGFALIVGATDSLNNTIALGKENLHLRSRFSREAMPHFREPDEHLVHLRRDVWQALIERMQIRRAMSIAAWEKLQKEVESEDPPEINAENLTSMVEQFREDIPAMLKAAVDEVFDWLRPRGDRYKTNSQFEIGERVVLTSVVSRGFGRNWDTCHYRDQYLTALENVFYMVAGEARPEDGYYSAIATRIKSIPNGQPCIGATELFEFKGFKNGNMHLRFRRMDLVAKLNAIAGGARLKPVSAEARP